MKYAIIENGVVVNIAVADAPLDAAWIPAGNARIGNLWDGTTFTERPLTEEELAEQKALAVEQAKEAAQRRAQDIVLKEQIATKLDTLPDEDVAELAYLYDEWSGDGVAYAIGDIVRVESFPYRVLQAHTSQADWTPANTASLFTPLRTVTGSNPDPWVQPQGAQNAYAIGDRVTHDNLNDGGNIWIFESAIAANTTEPGRDGTFDRWWTPIEAVA